VVGDLPVPEDPRLVRVSDAEREQVAEILREAAGQGRITVDELETRLEVGYSAKTYADLAAVTGDLPVQGSSALASAGGSAFPAQRVGGTPKRRWCVALLSGARRRGAWVVPADYTAVAVMGGVDLDLREARFSAHTVTIHAFALMGGVNILVPDGIDVDVGGVGFMGGFDHKASETALPGAPLLRVNGFAMMGGVSVERKPIKTRKKQRPKLGRGGAAELEG
jgi:hypothetical protein